LQQLSFRLEKLPTADEVSAARARELLERIDQLGRPAVAALLNEYLSCVDAASDVRGQQIWNVVTAYLDRLTRAYRWCLEKFQASASVGRASAPVLAAVAVDAIRACGARQKWGYLRHYQPTPEQWAELMWFYLAAKRAASAQDGLPSQATATGSAVEQAFLKVLALAVSSPSGLAPAQIELAERLIATCAGQLALAPAGPTPTSHFIDIGAALGPQRLLGSMTLPSSARNIQLSGAVHKLLQLAEDLDSGLLTPADLGLDLGRPGLASATLRHLSRHWRGKSVRRHPRQRKVFRVAVVHGFDEVALKLSGGAALAPSAGWQEDWIVEDRSASGLLAMLPRQQGRAVHAGSLIAFRYPNEPVWHAGIVRRVQREEEETRQLAIERLPIGSADVSIQPGVGRNAAEEEHAIEGMQLLMSSLAEDQISLLLPIGTFSPSAPLQMRTNGKAYLLIPQLLVESGNDYEIACFKLLKRAE
jgi:hypothetical protein